MGAIVRIQTTTARAATAFSEVVSADPSVYSTELGKNSGMHEVVFQSADVEMGTGLVTLRRLMNDHTPGAGDEIIPVSFG